MRIILCNGKVITPYRIIQNGHILVKNGKILAVSDSPLTIRNGDLVIDVKGSYIAPGFIDLHTHGAGDHDFMDGTAEAFREAGKTHLKYGTTSLVPTTLTSSIDELLETLDVFAKVQKEDIGPNLLGLHLEGPYLALEQCGAQDPKYIKNPDPKEYRRVLAYSDAIVRWTIAPELPGALEMGKELTERGVLCSIGHSNANYEEVVKAFEVGYTHVTHLYSAMSVVHRRDLYRYSGVVESAYLLDDMTVEIIADGVHLPASLLQLIYKIKGASRICLVTDSMRAAGQSRGESILGSKKQGQKVLIEDGVAKLKDGSAFAGSIATADRLIRTMVELGRVPLEKAVEMLTLTPAKVLGITANKGSIAQGKDADLTIFDENINVEIVLVGGQVRYQAK